MKENSKENMPLVSIISINYNQSGVTMEMLESLRKVTYSNIEIFVVDNASPSDSPDVIKEKYPEVNLIKSEENLGFAGGNNLAILQSKGEYILLLNNDTEVDPGFLGPLVDKLRQNPEIGVVSPKIYFHHTPGMLQFAGISEINPFTVRNTGWGYGKKDDPEFEKDRESFFAHGAAMMVPRKVINEVGLMAAIYFLYYEEMDWAKRIRNAGYKVFYVHNSFVYHKESISTGKNSPLKTYYMNRGRLIFLRRNTKGWMILPAMFFQFLVSAPKNTFTFALKREGKLLSAYTKAFAWFIANLFNKKLTQNEYLPYQPENNKIQTSKPKVLQHNNP